MALRAKKPQLVQKRLKTLFYGNAGVGKTTAAIQFPMPYLVDTERGSENDQYVKHLDKVGGVVFHTSDFEELVNEVKSLLTVKHEYRTLIIDPLTILYNNLLDRAELKVGSDFGRHYAEANKRIKHLLNLLLRLDMNVIITSHAKPEYGQNMAVIGSTFDCYKKLDYLFDLVFEIQKRGKDRVALVKKTRIETFGEGEVIPFSYNEIADRYGREILERDAMAQSLATVDQVAEYKRLVELLNVGPETQEKWFEKAKAETAEELPQDVILKLTDAMKDRIEGKNNGTNK